MTNGPQQPDARPAGRIVGLLILVLVVIGGAGATLYATGPWWLPQVASLHGLEIDRLFLNTLLVTGAVFIFVHVLLALFVWRYAERGDSPRTPDSRRPAATLEHSGHDEGGAQDRTERFAYILELSYTIAPAIALAVMVSMGGVVWARIHRAPPADAMLVEMRGEQFAWRAHYPGPDGVLGRLNPEKINERTNPMGLDPDDPASRDDIISSELHLVVNRPVRVRVRSRDVIHSLFLAEFRVKQDALPGSLIEIWFVPTREGQFEIACAELCGVGHYIMRGTLKVDSPQAFEAWMGQQKPALQQP